MVRIILNGCNGYMGQNVARIVGETEGAEVVAGIDTREVADSPFPVFTDIAECNVEADVIIDFSSVKAIDHLLDYCEESGMPLVLCTTGLSEEQINRVSEVS